MVSLAIPSEDALALLEPRRRKVPARYEAVQLLSSVGRVSAADLCYFTGVSPAALRSMEKSGIIAFSQEEELRVPQL